MSETHAYDHDSEDYSAGTLEEACERFRAAEIRYGRNHIMIGERELFIGGTVSIEH